MGSTTRKLKAFFAVSLVAVTGLLASACSSDADIASSNLSLAAEQFEINRRIVFYNSITDTYLLEIVGLCSIETADSKAEGSVEVTCKTGPTEYKKHFLGLSDNVTYVLEQLEPVDVSVYNYRVLYKPDQIVPDIELSTQMVTK